MKVYFNNYFLGGIVFWMIGLTDMGTFAYYNYRMDIDFILGIVAFVVGCLLFGISFDENEYKRLKEKSVKQ